MSESSHYWFIAKKEEKKIVLKCSKCGKEVEINFSV